MTKEVWLAQAKASSEGGRYAEALKKFQAAIELDNNCAEAWYGRAQTLVDLAQYRPATEAYERARQLDSAGYSAIALFGIGNCYVGMGDRLRAIRFYDQALQENSKLTRAWHNRGTALFELERYEDAAASYAHELEIEPSNVKAQIWRAHCLERLGRTEQAPQQQHNPQDAATAWMEIATHEYKAGDAQHALIAYQRAAAAQPAMGYAWTGQGACLAIMGRAQEALQALDHAVSLDDDSRSMALAYRAQILKGAGRQGESEEAYERTLRAAPASLEDHKARAFALYASEHYEEALAGLKVLKRLDPQNAEAWHLEGLCFDALERFAEAAASFDEFLKRSPENARAWFRYARALTATGKADQAADCCDKAIALGYTTENSWLQKAITLASLERYAEAVPCMDKAMEQSPGWDEALYNRGVCRYHLGRHEAAIEDFDAVLEQGEPSRHSIMALEFKEKSLTALGQTAAAESCRTAIQAYVALAQEKFDDAARLFRDALQQDARNAAASLRLSALLVGRGDPQEATEQLAQSLALRPQNVELWSTRGVVLGRLDKNDKNEEALECYEKALEIDSLYLPALRNSAITLVEAGRPQEALDRYERALALEDGNANAWYGRGVCLARLGRVEEAVQAFRRAVELAPRDAEAWHDLGTCLLNINKYQEALQAWQRAASLDPGIDLNEKIQRLQAATDNTSQVRFLSLAAYHYFNQGNYAEAARYFDAALKLTPENDGLWNDRGICAEHLEGSAQAIRYFDRAIALDPEQPQTWYNKAVSLQNLRRLPEAVDAFEKELAIHESKNLPTDENLVHGHHNLASCLMLMGKMEEALDHFDEVLALARENPEKWREEANRAQSLKKTLLGRAAKGN